MGEYSLMVDLKSTHLTKEERTLLLNPKVGGIILFSRNFEHEQQLKKLMLDIRSLDRPRLIVALDQEGGRVQRFKTPPFSVLPAAQQIGQLWDQNQRIAQQAARALGGIIGHELKNFDVDLVFAPVLDLDYGASCVIGSRAFHAKAEVVVALAKAFIKGLNQTGVNHCGKHFPGHGFVGADSHVDLPVDHRDVPQLMQDLWPYQKLHLNALMRAHVIYPAVSPKTAVFSKTWNQKIREEYQFKGAIFTDDLSMQGAGVAGNMLSRVQEAWSAGNDMLLICNDFSSACAVIQKWHPSVRPDDAQRLRRLKKLFLIKNDSFLDYSKNLSFLKDLDLLH